MLPTSLRSLTTVTHYLLMDDIDALVSRLTTERNRARLLP
jgi:hypothetical protein